jgi:hypothetical protein
MDDRHCDLPPEFEERWREWSRTEPTLDEAGLKRAVMERTRNRHPRRRAPLVLAAAAASMLAILIGFESTRRQPDLATVERATVVHETANNVILVLREGKTPIYVLTESAEKTEGVGP